jgi:hypothetical protein
VKKIKLHHLFLFTSSFLIFSFAFGMETPPAVEGEQAATNAEPAAAPTEPAPTEEEAKPGVVTTAGKGALAEAGLPTTREEVAKGVVDVGVVAAQKGIEAGFGALKRLITGQPKLAPVTVGKLTFGYVVALRSDSGRFLGDEEGDPNQLNVESINVLPDNAKWILVDPDKPDRTGPITPQDAANGLLLRNKGTGRYLAVERRKVVAAQQGGKWKISDLRGTGMPQLESGYRVLLLDTEGKYLTARSHLLGKGVFLKPKKAKSSEWVPVPIGVAPPAAPAKAAPAVAPAKPAAPPTPPTTKDEMIRKLQEQMVEMQKQLQKLMGGGQNKTNSAAFAS